MRYKSMFTLMFLLAVSTAAWAQPVRPMQPGQMAGYWDEAHKLPKGEFLRKLVDPDQIPSSVGLAIVNGEYVWVVTIDSGPIRPAFEARVRAEFAKFTDKQVIFGVQKRADIHGGNSSGAWLPPPGTN
jgi:hypothetical protein